MKPENITQLINCVYEGVENSKLGKIERKDDKGNVVLNSLAFQAFTTIISSIVPKDLNIITPKEPWQE